jgi:Co/Zn/Cd efflux system component
MGRNTLSIYPRNRDTFCCLAHRAGLMAGSVSLQADALDFLGDVANYGISIFVIGMVLRYRATAALVKGATMGLFGVWVIVATVFHALQGTVPHAVTMGEVGFAALVANAVVFGLLWISRKGDSKYAFYLAMLT